MLSTKEYYIDHDNIYFRYASWELVVARMNGTVPVCKDLSYLSAREFKMEKEVDLVKEVTISEQYDNLVTHF